MLSSYRLETSHHTYRIDPRESSSKLAGAVTGNDGARTDTMHAKSVKMKRNTAMALFIRAVHRVAPRHCPFQPKSVAVLPSVESLTTLSAYVARRVICIKQSLLKLDSL